MSSQLNTVSADTLKARSVEQRLYKIYVELDERDGDHMSDLGMAARLAWMEAGRALEAFCERDGINRWTHRWT